MLKASGDGLVVSISSIAALTGVGSSIAYCAAKAGIEVMTKSLARALAPEVRVMSVAPGVVDTGFVPGRGAEFNAKTAASTPLRRIATRGGHRRGRARLRDNPSLLHRLDRRRRRRPLL